jgi:hypothetical protein
VGIDLELDYTPNSPSLVESGKRDSDLIADSVNVDNQLIGLLAEKSTGQIGNHGEAMGTVQETA